MITRGQLLSPKLALSALLLFIVLFSFFKIIFSGKILSLPLNLEHKSPVPQHLEMKAIDTMKYSRDKAQEKLDDPTFDATIDTQMAAIEQTGATHVAIATPYDEKFIPILTRWVQSARRHKLKVWFRGNFSSWEGWFGNDQGLTREEHLNLTRQFIEKHANLFEDGDVFSACPECENGKNQDPRQYGDVEGFRNFLISEHGAATEEFQKINKNVDTNLVSMNFDVATLVMDEATTKALGNVITIDHYVKDPQKLRDDIKMLHEKTGADIVLGEIGAPIPDIHGNMNPQQQADWLDNALALIYNEKYVTGISYWTSFGGSTAIFNSDGQSKPAANILKKYYKLHN